MNKLHDSQRLRIFHPTDLSHESTRAFAHATKLAVASRGELNILHVKDNLPHDAEDVPRVRQLLEKWGLLPENSPRQAVGELDIFIRKITKQKSDPVESCVEYLENHPIGLIVMMIHQNENGWLRKHVGGPIARQSRIMTLFIPEGTEGFIEYDTGAISLNKVLIPVAESPSVFEANAKLHRLQQRLGIEKLDITYLHVGEQKSIPDVDYLSSPTWRTEMIFRDGNVAEEIIEASKDHDLTVMVTEGRHGFLDVLRGSVAEQVVRKIHSPLLVVPAEDVYNNG